MHTLPRLPMLQPMYSIVLIFLLAVLYRYEKHRAAYLSIVQSELNVTVLCLVLTVTATRAPVIGGVHDAAPDFSRIE
ncbi:hypothetical protein N7491_010696 [Penicillium cf. griseofulvum]|uniref:Uncharacterized protein n=1 Tax=Penicillium cf. griseofulvum TaxID=2972120 RepID=A0A9W9N0F1_9EURO|nr:hypothetical protein N7472_001021 [Penicillium cf. griseofulvum]KAJ5422251.1 hypothetical protein N7491_010696 [Penicillium cf. griseofulvum]KAJ5428434.1 hypothetical protein N7445_009888 [Penicillium cf. griseofulvum]